VRSCGEVEQQLFLDEYALDDVEEEFMSPPRGLVILGLEELILISKEKRRPLRLSRRWIQILRRRMEKFVPSMKSRRRDRVAAAVFH
jgi:hypothetical protein